MKRFIIAALLALGAAACSTTPSPVSDVYRTGYAVETVGVALSDPEGVPDRYDASVMRILEESGAIAPTDEAQFREFAEAAGGLTADNAGERMLEFLIATQLNEGLPRHFSGARPAGIAVEVIDTTFPNAATMLLVGEVIGAKYHLRMTDTGSDTVLVQSNEPIIPVVQRSAGAGGGLLGMALRSGENRHLQDLQNVATGIAEEVITILSGGQIYPYDAKKLDIYPVPADEASAGTDTDSGDGREAAGEPVSD